jgi:hypothetical protein
MGVTQVGLGGDSVQVNDLLIGVASTTTQSSGSSVGLSGYPSLSGGKVKLSGVNFNATNGTDTSFTLYLPNGVTLFQIEGVGITNASHTLVTATVGLYTAASAGGTALITAATAVTVATATVGGANSAQFITGLGTVNASSTVNSSNGVNSTTLYFNLTAQEGAAATADVYIYVRFF